MTKHSHGPCSECGAEIPAHAPGGRCPRCLLRFALDPAGEDSDTFAPDTAATQRPFGDYLLLHEVARGGMGVVFKARQISLNRTVAIKMLLAGCFSSADHLQRFRTEAEAAAKLQHPNIVAIHEIGEQEGHPYFAMEFVDGPNLAQCVRDHPMPPQRAARLANGIAEAAHYAHLRGVIHRDLKPSNVLVTGQDQPRVTDFGLAKVITNATEVLIPPPPGSLKSPPPEAPSMLTATGQILGTPGFMPPEQASGKRSAITPQSDVYSIGAILYYLVTARAPFSADSLEGTLRQVMESDPLSPRMLNPEVPRDLETICLKCLEKDPARRYGTARELGQDLERYLSGRPIHARPVSIAEKGWRWCTRNPMVAILGGLLVCMMVGGALGIRWQLRRAMAGELAARRNAYCTDMNLAQLALKANNLRRARELLNRNRPEPGQKDLRDWEWRLAWAEGKSDAEQSFTNSVTFPLNICHPFHSPYLFVGNPEGTLVRYEIQGSQMVNPTTLSTTGQVSVIQSSLDGSKVALTGGRGEVYVCNPAGEHQGPPLKHPMSVHSMSFSPDNRLLATSGFDYKIRVWDVNLGKVIQMFAATSYPAMYFGDIGFSPSGKELAVGRGDGHVRLMDVTSGELLWDATVASEAISALSFSPDGRFIAAGSGYSDSGITVLDADGGTTVKRLDGHSSWISALLFTPDGKHLLSSSADQTVRQWKVDEWKESRVMRGHMREVHCMTWLEGNEGHTLISADQDGILNAWNPTSEQRPSYPRSLPGPFQAAQFLNHDSQICVIRQGAVVLFDAAQCREQIGIDTLGTNNVTMTVASDESLLITGEQDGHIQVWDLRSSRLLTRFKGHEKALTSLGLSQSGTELVSVGHEGMVCVWSRNDWHLQNSWRWKDRVDSFHRNKLLLSHGLWVTQHKGAAKIWNAFTGTLIQELSTEMSYIDAVGISSNGRWFAAGNQDGMVSIFDGKSWKLHVQFRGHVAGVHGIAFSPDGTRLATGSNGKEAVKLWDTTTWQELATLPGQGSLFRVYITSSGNVLAAISSDRKLHFWRAPNLEQIEAAEHSKQPSPTLPAR